MRERKLQGRKAKKASASQIILAIFSLIIVLSVVLSLFINS
jgi:hypothetical protein